MHILLVTLGFFFLNLLQIGESDKTFQLRKGEYDVNNYCIKKFNNTIYCIDRHVKSVYIVDSGLNLVNSFHINIIPIDFYADDHGNFFMYDSDSIYEIRKSGKYSCSFSLKKWNSIIIGNHMEGVKTLLEKYSKFVVRDIQRTNDSCITLAVDFDLIVIKKRHEGEYKEISIRLPVDNIDYNLLFINSTLKIIYYSDNVYIKKFDITNNHETIIGKFEYFPRDTSKGAIFIKPSAPVIMFNEASYFTLTPNSTGTTITKHIISDSAPNVPR